MTIAVQFNGDIFTVKNVTWMKDDRPLTKDWSQAYTAGGLISISKQNVAYSDIGNYTLVVSTPSFSNPLFKTTTTTTALDVLGK